MTATGRKSCQMGTVVFLNSQMHLYSMYYRRLVGSPIKLIQVASNSELRENQWNNLLFFEIVPSHCFRASKASKIDRFRKLESFGPKIEIPHWKMDILVPLIFQEIEFFEHVQFNFKNSWPEKISVLKIAFAAKITLISMIKKMPLTFLDVKK